MNDLASLERNPDFSRDQVAQHVAMLAERVFQTDTKWPHFRLLLSDLGRLADELPDGSLVVSLERGMLYGGYSLAAPVFTGKRVIAADCSPQSADDRGAYNAKMVDDERFLTVPSSLRTRIEDTGLPAESADLVIVPNLVHHVADQAALFDEVKRLLKPGGKAYVFEPLVRELHQSPDDYLRYTPFGLERTMREHGLEPVRTATEGGPFSAIAYCWAQALEYFPEGKREEMSDWFYNEHFPQLMAWDTAHTQNQVRRFTSFPMAFSVTAAKPGADA